MNITFFDAETGDVESKELSQQDVLELKESLIVNEPIPTIGLYENAIQALIEETAQSRQFRDAATMASYTSSTIPLWSAQATAFVAWRDAVWMYAYEELDKVTTGTRPQPTVSEILDELPKIVWPEE
jgi:hypothetical protein